MERFGIWDMGNGISAPTGDKALAVVLAATSICACQGGIFVEEQKRQSGTQRNVIPIETVSKADILFLVDNSGSMAQEQENLAKNFADFIKEVLKGQNDFHIGLVTTDVNFNPLTECKPGGACPNGMGCVQATTPSGAVKAGTYYCVTPSPDADECNSDDECTPGVDCCPNYSCNSQGDCTPSACGTILGFTKGRKYCYPMNNGRLRYNSCRKGYSTSERDDRCEFGETHGKVMTGRLQMELGDEDFRAMFRDNVKVGTNGTGFEKGLSALRHALDAEYVDPVTGLNLVGHENAGFLRPEAWLTLIVVSDEEDCSHDPFDPNFDEKKNTNEVCYPSPNTCHPDCQPREAGNGCNTTMVPPEQETAAVEDSEYVKKGVEYCMIPCTGPADCENAPVSGMGCGKVNGFGNQQYCNCRFDAPTTNTNSKYAYLTPTQDFVDFFLRLKRDNKGRPRPGDVNMAAIIGAARSGSGAGEPGNCSSPNGVACAGRRYHEVASGMSEFLSDSICQDDFKETLIKIVQVLIISNERVLSDEPVDPSCIQVSVGGDAVEHCKTLTSCGTQARDGGAGDGGTDDTTCPEAGKFCEKPGEECTDKAGSPCDCAAISDPDRGCHCGSDSKNTCIKPIFWQYKPPADCSTGSCCPGNDQPRVVFHGCGLEAGDKLEINFLSGGTTTAEGGTKCE
ncbi:MAG: hypothetical protein HY897_00375 [Deltaproteobacteria bacterium]|nr:hypothetical protein [Deltaproteobacteria bacterium]